jgi:hypothetical protein
MRTRIFAIDCGYEDADDLDRLDAEQVLVPAATLDLDVVGT